MNKEKHLDAVADFWRYKAHHDWMTLDHRRFDNAFNSFVNLARQTLRDRDIGHMQMAYQQYLADANKTHRYLPPAKELLLAYVLLNSVEEILGVVVGEA